MLIVSTNVGVLQGEPNGTFLMEIAYPVEAFRKLGIEIDILTPGGGQAAVYYCGPISASLKTIEQSENFQIKSKPLLGRPRWR